ASSRQLSATARRNGSVFGQALWSESDRTLSGYLAASHIPTDAPNDRPDTCALGRPTACMNAATSSASTSNEYGVCGLSLSPVPRRSIDRHVNCLAYSGTWYA